MKLSYYLKLRYCSQVKSSCRCTKLYTHTLFSFYFPFYPIFLLHHQKPKIPKGGERNGPFSTSSKLLFLKQQYFGRCLADARRMGDLGGHGRHLWLLNSLHLKCDLIFSEWMPFFVFLIFPFYFYCCCRCHYCHHGHSVDNDVDNDDIYHPLYHHYFCYDGDNYSDIVIQHGVAGKCKMKCQLM